MSGNHCGDCACLLTVNASAFCNHVDCPAEVRFDPPKGPHACPEWTPNGATRAAMALEAQTDNAATCVACDGPALITLKGRPYCGPCYARLNAADPDLEIVLTHGGGSWLPEDPSSEPEDGGDA